MSTVIRAATVADAGGIAGVYNYYILNSPATFEEQAVDEAGMRARMSSGMEHGYPWVVAEAAGRIVGYAYAGLWKARSAYRYSAEVSIYLDHESTAGGLGTRLYTVLFAELRKRQVHILIGGITLPNPASQALHEKFGMKKVAHFERVGFKQNQWWDVGYWQMELVAESDLF